MRGIECPASHGESWGMLCNGFCAVISSELLPTDKAQCSVTYTLFTTYLAIVGVTHTSRMDNKLVCTKNDVPDYYREE